MLKDLLLQNRSSIIKRWFHQILETYPPDTSQFLKNQKDRFGNPVGYTFSQGVEALFEALLDGQIREEASSFLDHMIRIRAVQDFSPSQAVSFVFLLKSAVREGLEKEIREKGLMKELWEFESRVDELALLGFEIYMKCRERLYEIRSNELKHRTFRLLERANLICSAPEGEPDLIDGDRKSVS